MTLQTPINGRVSDIVGRKPMVCPSLPWRGSAHPLRDVYRDCRLHHLFSSMWCSEEYDLVGRSSLGDLALTGRRLIIARAFQGLGGGSIIGLT